MKRISIYFQLVLFSALAACVFTGCRTANERPQMCTVVSVSGDARYWDGESNKVHTIKRGDRIPPGSTIQTATGAGNYVDLVTAERFQNMYGSYPSTFHPADKLRIYEGSVLKLNKVTLKTVEKNRIPDTRLLLLQGSFIFYPETALNMQPASDKNVAPYYELRGSNVVVRAERANFWMSASGMVRTLGSIATVERLDDGITKVMSPWQTYNPLTREISPIPTELELDIASSLYPCIAPPPPAPWAPAFQVPQRPF